MDAADFELVESTAEMQFDSHSDAENQAPIELTTPIFDALIVGMNDFYSIDAAAKAAAKGLERLCRRVSYVDYSDMLTSCSRSAIPMADFLRLQQLRGLFFHYLMPYPMGTGPHMGTGVQNWIRVLGAADERQVLTPINVPRFDVADRRTWAPAPARKFVSSNLAGEPSKSERQTEDYVMLRNARPNYFPKSKFPDRFSNDVVVATAGSTPHSIKTNSAAVNLDYTDKALSDLWTEDIDRRLSFVPLTGTHHSQIASTVAKVSADGALDIEGFTRVVMPQLEYFLDERPYVAVLPIYNHLKLAGTVAIIVIQTLENLSIASRLAVAIESD